VYAPTEEEEEAKQQLYEELHKVQELENNGEYC
jgi:hypothetical protein